MLGKGPGECSIGMVKDPLSRHYLLHPYVAMVVARVFLPSPHHSILICTVGDALLARKRGGVSPAPVVRLSTKHLSLW